MDKSRQMIYPYTIPAKIAHFPYKYYWNHSVTFRFFIYGSLAVLPLFLKINGIVNSPGNVAAWEEKKRKEHEEYLKHQEHLL